jgi:hypothetical protein
MTSIGKPDGGAVGSWSSDLSGRRALDDRSSDLDDRRNARADHGDRLGCGLDVHTPDAPLIIARAAAFDERFRAAVRELGDADQNGEAEQGSELGAQANILAVAQAPSGTGLPVPAASAESGAARQAAREAAVAVVTQRIEAAIRAETRPSAERPLDLHVTLGQDFHGVTGLRLVVTPATLDVVLERTASGVSEQLSAAAAELAESLCARFSKDRVRILTRPTSRAGDSEPQVGSLSDLFRSNG